MLSTNKSNFQVFLEGVRKRRIYFDRMTGNNGDKLITMGAEWLLNECGCKTVQAPDQGELIVINGGNTNDTWRGRVDKLAYYRRNYPAITLIVAPSSFRFRGIDFREICLISSSPFTLFARERYSADILREMDLPPYVDVQVSQDLAFELGDTAFICELREKLIEKHILITMRRDLEGPAGILTRTHARWLPKQVRKPLSRLRDRLTAYRSQNVVNEILRYERIPRGIARIYRDVSEALSFDEFVHVISNSRTIITDRLHYGILGFLLDKRVILIPREDHKVKGVYEFSMSGPDSRTSLWRT